MKKTPLPLAQISFKVDDERDFKNFLKYLSSPWRIMLRNFLSGTFHGLGFVVGTAIFLTVFGFIVNRIVGEIPFFSDFAKAINVWLEQNVHQ